MLTLNIPAKINWFLLIDGLRSDGFHEIQSLVQKVSLYDTIEFTPSNELTLETDAQIPVEHNLVYRAAVLLRDMAGTDKGASIKLNKRIPMGAGLGGGSSDAAAALTGLNRLWSLGLSPDELHKAAEQLGSDVPFFLYGAAAYVHGRGERIVPCNPLKKIDILLVKPPFEIPTAWAYGQLDAQRDAGHAKKKKTGPSLHTGGVTELTKKGGKVNNIEHFIRNIERAELDKMTGCISNDLEPVVMQSFPVIAEIKHILREQGAVCSLMSGSGSTVFGVFETGGMAGNAAGALQKYWTAVVQTIVD